MANWTREFEAAVKPFLIVCAFIILLTFGFCREAEAEVTAEIGPGFLSGQLSDGAALIFTERWGGPYGSRYSIGMGYMSEQVVVDRSRTRYEFGENLWVQAQRRVCFIEGYRLCLGIGVAYFNATNRALGSNFTAALSIEALPQKHMSINIRHYSNAGSGRPNMGQDMLTIGWTF